MMRTRGLQQALALSWLCLAHCGPGWPCEFRSAAPSVVSGLCARGDCADTAWIANDSELEFDWLLRIENPPKLRDKTHLQVVSSAPARVRVTHLTVDDVVQVHESNSCLSGRQISFHGRLSAKEAGSVQLLALDGEQQIGAFPIQVREVATVTVFPGTQEDENVARSGEAPEPGLPITSITLHEGTTDRFWMRAVARAKSGEALRLSDDLISWSVEPAGIVDLNAQAQVASLFAKRAGATLLRVKAGRASLEIPVQVTPYPPTEVDADASVGDADGKEGDASALDAGVSALSF